jgi:probable phosphoglycerate mutase
LIKLPLTYVVRHGQTDWNAEYRLQGQADTDITETGRRQADRNGRKLSGLINDSHLFDFVASPMRRTCETMERIRIAMGLAPDGYRTDARLMELHFGDWQGFTFAELEAQKPGSTEARLLDKWRYVPPGKSAESYEMLLERVRPWLEALDQPTVCVTHGGVIRTLFKMLEAMSDDDAAALDIVQDRVLKVENGRLDWL